MIQRIGLVTVVVSDYDEAISYYTQQLGFVLVEDTPLSDKKRWVVVAPQGAKASGLLLAKAANDRQRQAIGSQAGGRVFLFLHTDDFYHDFAIYKKRGVKFIEEPRSEEYGIVAVFVDLYGNRWDLIESKERGFP
jgi:catechol 2,3-dioxygenase-like lactoylglutathione lyase family enzyme